MKVLELLFWNYVYFDKTDNKLIWKNAMSWQLHKNYIPIYLVIARNHSRSIPRGRIFGKRDYSNVTDS